MPVRLPCIVERGDGIRTAVKKILGKSTGPHCWAATGARLGRMERTRQSGLDRGSRGVALR